MATGDFADFALPYLESARDEASRLVLDAVADGDYAGDAFAEAIEALPAKKTLRLRKIAALFEPWLDWLAHEGAGWSVKEEKLGSRQDVVVYAPRDAGWDDVRDVFGNQSRSRDMIAAAAGVLRVGGAFQPERISDGPNHFRYVRVYVVLES